LINKQDITRNYERPIPIDVCLNEIEELSCSVFPKLQTVAEAQSREYAVPFKIV